MLTHKHIWFWILGGIIVATVLIYFMLSNGVFNNQPGQPSASTNNQSSLPAGASAQAEIINNQPAGPSVSAPVAAVEVPKSAIKLSVTRSAFTPASFTVQAGETVVVSVTSGEARNHALVFDDASLSGVVVGLAPNETRVITFEAPSKPGSYAFRSTALGDTAAGTMVVR
jgi:plastocyanin